MIRFDPDEAFDASYGGVRHKPSTAKRRAFRPAVFVSMDCRVEPGNDKVRDQLSKKLRSFRDRDGCFSLRSAFASSLPDAFARDRELLADFFA